MSEALNPNEREVIMKELLLGIGAVAQAGLEQGQEDTSAIDLPEETIVRAGEIYHQIKAE